MILPLPTKDPPAESEEEAEKGRRRIGSKPEESLDGVDPDRQMQHPKVVGAEVGLGTLRQASDGLYT